MRLATISYENHVEVAIVVDRGVIPLSKIISTFGLPKLWLTDLKTIISQYLDELVSWYQKHQQELADLKAIPLVDTTFLPLYHNPDKIWGIGLNYADHAADLDEGTPDKFPGSFMRPATTIIGHHDPVSLPTLSQKTTGEGELAIVIGKTCKNVSQENWLDVVAGFTTVIDMTAEDILRQNPRFLTLSKSFDSYFSFGPVLITADEFNTEQIMDLEVCTVHNGNIHARNVVRNMRYPPDFLVSFHSQVMKLLPGDIISTGTPRAKHIEAGDVIGCYISGFYDLANPVICSVSSDNTQISG